MLSVYTTVDLLLAATAELSGLTLVHYDHDFDEIFKITGQPAVWIATPGSVSYVVLGRSSSRGRGHLAERR